MIKLMTLLWVQCKNSVKYYSNSWTQWKVMARTTSKTTIIMVTLTFDQWPWSRLWYFLGSGVAILWNITQIHAFSKLSWPRQCLNHYEHSDLDHLTITMNQGHDIFLDPGQQSCEVLFKSIKRVSCYGPDKLYAYLKHYVCSDLDLWPVISHQGHDTSFRPV
jgi:hypothetical protein